MVAAQVLSASSYVGKCTINPTWAQLFYDLRADGLYIVCTEGHSMKVS
jgi:hypothetical protein